MFDASTKEADPEPGTVTGLVLCGGRSQRMGRDKALLDLQGETMLARTVASVQPLVDECLLACGAESRYADLGLPLVLDDSEGKGPLAGLAAGLAAARGDWIVVLACDMPHVTERVLRKLLEHARAGGLDVCHLDSPRGPEPLCGVYRQACLGPVRAALLAGERRMVGFWSRPTETGASLRIGGVPSSECGDGQDPTINLNTPDDWTRERAGAGAAS
jgi:molybdopterin-guanine dinucleotide biosynthesis protein A